MSAHADAALDLIDPERKGCTPGDTVPVGRCVRLLSDQLREVDSLTQELAQAKANETVAISYAGECKADLVRSEAELAERTRERDAAQTEVCEYQAAAASEGFYTPEEVAKHARGWPHLYPEEPQP